MNVLIRLLHFYCSFIFLPRCACVQDQC